jgi:predicted RecA/RadA family phage recombinase
MKNFIQPGHTVTLVAPYAVLAGAGALVGTIFGVAACDVDNGAEGEFDLEGVFDLPKAAGVVTRGVALYWDDTAKKLTTADEGNTRVGAAVLAAASDAALVRVRLDGMGQYVERRTVTLTAPYNVAAGAGALVGTIFGVAKAPVAQGDDGEFYLDGPFSLAKATGEITQGATLYWDNTAKKLTTTAQSNTKIGAALVGATSAATVVLAWLNGSF